MERETQFIGQSAAFQDAVERASMAAALDRPVLTTSVGFGRGAHNELAAAALTARHWETAHYEETLEPALDEVMDRVVTGFDEPFADASAIPTYYVSRAARDLVIGRLSESPRVRLTRPDGAFYLFFRVEGEPDSRALALRLLQPEEGS